MFEDYSNNDFLIVDESVIKWVRFSYNLYFSQESGGGSISKMNFHYNNALLKMPMSYVIFSV